MAIIKTSDTSFEKDVLKAEKPVIVDFWAEWCGPCKMIAPHLEDLEKELGDKIQVVKVNIDDQSPHADQVRRARHPDPDALQERRRRRDQGRRSAEAPARRLGPGEPLTYSRAGILRRGCPLVHALPAGFPRPREQRRASWSG